MFSNKNVQIKLRLNFFNENDIRNEKNKRRKKIKTDLNQLCTESTEFSAGYIFVKRGQDGMTTHFNWERERERAGNQPASEVLTNSFRLFFDDAQSAGNQWTFIHFAIVIHNSMCTTIKTQTPNNKLLFYSQETNTIPFHHQNIVGCKRAHGQALRQLSSGKILNTI